MSHKDRRFYSECPICANRLIGSDDGAEVYESLQSQVEAKEEQPCCTLCGEQVTVAEAKAIVEKGPPKLYDSKTNEETSL